MAEITDQIHTGHRERLKNRFLSSGFASFQPHEIIEFFLFFSIPRKNTNNIAHNILAHYGSLELVFNANVDDLANIHGVGQKSAILLTAIGQSLQLCDYDFATSKNPVFSTTNDIVRFLRDKFVRATKEKVIALFVDSSCKLLKEELLSTGTANSASCLLKTIIEIALRIDATGVILSHCHPRGIAMPSDEDNILTLKVSNILRTIDITLVEHLIFAKNEVFSYALEAKEYLNGSGDYIY